MSTQIFIEVLEYIPQVSYINLRSTIKRKKPIFGIEDFTKENNV